MCIVLININVCMFFNMVKSSNKTAPVCLVLSCTYGCIYLHVLKTCIGELSSLWLPFHRFVFLCLLSAPQVSQNSIATTVTSLWAGCPKGQDIFCITKMSRPELCPLSLLLSGCWRLFPRGVKRPSCEGGQWRALSVQLKNDWSCTSTSPYAFVAST